MDFKEALEILGIEEYSKRIFESNSHGELFHLVNYIVVADVVGKTDWFAPWFKKTVEEAEKTWKRPESIFQHIHKMVPDPPKNT